jgi:hypothetical protein
MTIPWMSETILVRKGARYAVLRKFHCGRPGVCGEIPFEESYMGSGMVSEY